MAELEAHRVAAERAEELEAMKQGGGDATEGGTCEDPRPHAWSMCASCFVLYFPVTCNPTRAVTPRSTRCYISFG